MESMDTLKKSAMLARLRNSKGFSLVEMAIVLVIIGIIIGAIIKGQDLILNSRAKQVASAASTWRNLAMAYLDRNGRLPGDGGKTGIIKTFTGYSGATGEIKSTMTTAPPQPVAVGGMTFYTYFGNTTGTVLGRNIIAICKDPTCTVKFTADELEIIKAVDNGIDGSADAGMGQFRGATVVTPGDPSAASGYIVTATGDTTTTGATKDWVLANNYVAAIWAFDRPF